MNNWKLKTTFLYHSYFPCLHLNISCFNSIKAVSTLRAGIIFIILSLPWCLSTYILNNLPSHERQHTDKKDKSISFQVI